MLELFLLWVWTGECGKYKLRQTKDCDHWGKSYCERLNDNSYKCAAWNNKIIPFHVYISKELQEMEKKIFPTMLWSFAKPRVTWFALLVNVMGCSLQINIFFPFCCNIKNISLIFWLN